MSIKQIVFPGEEMTENLLNPDKSIKEIKSKDKTDILK